MRCTMEYVVAGVDVRMFVRLGAQLGAFVRDVITQCDDVRAVHHREREVMLMRWSSGCAPTHVVIDAALLCH